MTKKNQNDEKNEYLTRLDAIIRLCIESQKENNQLNESSAARLLKSVGLQPTAIAKILGKKSATDVAPYLYGKNVQKKQKQQKVI